MTYSFVVEPVAVQEFESEDERIERCKEWNLLSGTATRVKTYMYKRQALTLPCEIVGFVDNQTVVIQFENKQQHCIHPAYLKEMQTAGFGQRSAAADARAEDLSEEVSVADTMEDQVIEAAGGEAPSFAESAEGEGSSESVTSNEKPAPKPKQPKPATSKKKAALQLPEDKLKVTAVVKEFTTVPNHFSDNDDEVIIYEGVTVEGHDLAIEEVWSSHSATLKKLELKEGDTVSFEAKIVAKKLTQHPVKYKINNPSKMKVIQPDS
ncbi:hypothetical protein KDC22_27000 [Paenibacillus tritici]|uniref:hypothetical protein n=1 Tax=Paenibacillus tritici TaxID=1873425 RepID=UPI001BABA194|nr:hypothetical protein [Paenibacillus tritici]QUL53951.1 hypothetical protein KDC22_27000 [Paenibacillus tritici]